MNLLESSTLTNQNISSALLVHTYTADAERKIFFRLFADAIAGDGDYVAYVTIQRAGAGSAYRVAPITTATVETGVTASMLQGVAFPVSIGDVVKVYLTGLAGDTATPDIITEVWDDDAVLSSVWTDAKAAYIDAAISSRGTLGSGSTSWPVTITVAGLPVEGVDVWVSTDSLSANVIARGVTNGSGVVTFMLDAGTYYCWKQLNGYTFTNPESMTVT